MYIYLRNRYEELTTPVTYVGHPPYNLILYVPWQNQQVIWPGLSNFIWMKDRNVSTWQEFALFVWIAINRVVDEIGTNATVVQQGIPLARGTVAGNGFAFPFGTDEEI